MSQLPISHRTIFLDVNAVRAARGISAAKVTELVEAGEFLWVFDLGLSKKAKHIRTLRFWSPEITNPKSAAGLDLAAVIARILPTSRSSFNGSELGHWLLISPPSVQRIGAQTKGVVKNQMLHVEREPLANFLRSRWIGGGN